MQDYAYVWIHTPCVEKRHWFVVTIQAPRPNGPDLRKMRNDSRLPRCRALELWIASLCRPCGKTRLFPAAESLQKMIISDSHSAFRGVVFCATSVSGRIVYGRSDANDLRVEAADFNIAAGN